MSNVMRLHWLVFAATLGFASVVEWSHFRRFQRKRDLTRMLFTSIAAIAAGYMASEAMEGNWPSWRGHGYED